MKIFKKMSLIIVSMVLLITSITGCTSSTSAGGENKESKARKWKIGHVRPKGTVVDNDVTEFVNNVKEASDGLIEIEIYPSSQLGDYNVVQERVGMADIEMQLAPAGTNVDKSLGISSAPYLATNWDEARELFKRDGVLINAIEEKFEKQGIKVIASYPVYFGGIALAKEPKDPANLQVSQNMKIRVPGIKSYEATAEALGYMATPIPYAEAFTAMQTGIVDGAIGSGAEGYYSSFRDVTKCYLPLNDHFEMWYLYMSLDVWNDLSDDEKKMLEEIGLKLEEKRYETAEADQKEFENKLKEEGIKVIEFTDEELANFAKKVRETVWPEIKDEFGAELFDSVTENIK
ncbi:TRAP transporter substrate-binding protein DctP [Anaeromicrobium sediminis]|nr:TRAP transporter substrate-binding protein DctP [Anaeromicrobium sediminis]